LKRVPFGLLEQGKEFVEGVENPNHRQGPGVGIFLAQKYVVEEV
jgi:hypothetical protein